MRNDAPYLVKRYAPMMGRPESPRRIAVAFNAYTLESALKEARYERDRVAAQPRLQPASFWIERRGAVATRPMTDDQVSPCSKKRRLTLTDITNGWAVRIMRTDGSWFLAHANNPGQRAILVVRASRTAGSRGPGRPPVGT